MNADDGPIVVTTGVCRGCNSIHTARAHHRDYPEVQAEGDTPAQAVAALVDRLGRVLDSAPDRWRGESVRSAIAEARDYAARGPEHRA